MKFLRNVQTFMLRLGAITLSVLALTAGEASAGVGWGDNNDAAGNPIKQQTYYANSPNGLHNPAACYDANGNFVTPVPGGTCDSGTALRKFVDPLPRLANPGGPNGDSSGKYIPLAVPTKWVNMQGVVTGDDYYEIAVVEYTEKFHSDLIKPTLLRGYVQIDPLASAGNGPSPQSKAIALRNPDNSPILLPNGSQAYGYDAPHYLGPTIVSNRNTPTRIKFYNLLPVGRADATKRNGDLFLPVDETLPGAGFGPDGKVKYTQNRAELHLHGGDNPWISDGTPHQWIAPAGESTANNGVYKEALAAGVPAADAAGYLRGVSAINVPDMPDPGPGAMTYYYPNGESARLMFYHDHSFGLTRLNVYAGEAAGYLLQDPIDTSLVQSGTLPTEEIELVIQDKGFVPKDIKIQDSRWDTQFWGAEGDLWFPHVYETNQDPNTVDGTKAVGRWDWGPYFWPVFPSYYDRLPTGEHISANTTPTHEGQTVGGIPVDTNVTEVTTTPEGFVDTPIVNGQAYPTLTVEPKAYRFRFLQASNDRFYNIGLYVAADKVTTNATEPRDPQNQPVVCDGVTARPDGTVPSVSDCTEVKMVYFDKSYPSTYYGVGSTNKFPDGSDPATAGLLGTGWGDPTGHLALWSGVPDPATAGPDIHQIGNEGGFLANVVTIPSTPINYEANLRSVTVMNVLEHGLILSPAGRADAVIDFSQYAGKTLILYNDNPAPMPAHDPRIDYYTGMIDYSTVGGTEPTLPGYGPNTRTVMQIHVKGPSEGAVPAAPFNIAALKTELDALGNVVGAQGAISKAYAANGDKAIYDANSADPDRKPIVPQLAYNAAFPGVASSDTLAHIYTGAIYLGAYKGLSFTATAPLTYTPVPTLPNGNVCTNSTDCTTYLKPAGATAVAGQQINAYIESKAIQELFDPTYGRMNATLGVELPFTTSLIQTTIPLGYVDPATETVKDGETQFWKITHNGVDSHPVHFHLVNVQIVNRIGWDGTIKAINMDELGWKETVIMNPLEDVVVAVRAKAPKLPFGLPVSVRPNDPSQPLGVLTGFTQVDPVTGNPATIANAIENYGWEYVWHCHILGHEENDFMRPFIFNYSPVAPDAPVLSAITGFPKATVPQDVNLSWTDLTPNTLPLTKWDPVSNPTGILGNPKNEVGFNVMRLRVTTPANTNWVKVSSGIANYTQYKDTVTEPGTYTYRIDAYNPKATTSSAIVAASHTIKIGTETQAIATGLTATANYAQKGINLAWTDNSVGEAYYRVERCIQSGAVSTVCSTQNSATTTNNAAGTNAWYTVDAAVPALAGTGAMTYAENTAKTANTTYYYRVRPVFAAAFANPYSAIAHATAYLPSVPTVAVVNTLTATTAHFAWTPGVLPVAPAVAVGPVVSNQVQQCIAAACVNAVGTLNGNAFDITGLKPNTTYTFRVNAGNAWGNSGWLTSAAQKTLISQVQGLSIVSYPSTTTVQLGWTNPNTASPAVTVLANGVAKTGAANITLTATGATVKTLIPGTAYTFTVGVTGAVGAAPTVSTAANNSVSNVVASNITATSLLLNWSNATGVNAAVTATPALPVGGKIVTTNNLAANTGSAVVTGLTSSTAYTFTVTAGGKTSTVLATTLAAASNLIATVDPIAGNTTVNLNWTNPSAATPIVKASGGSVDPASLTPTSAKIVGLNGDTLYMFSVQIAGQATLTTQAQTNADPATGVTVGGLTSTTANVSWTNPASFSSAALTVTPSAGVVIVPNATSNGASVTGLVPNTLYTYIVVVRGANGVAVQSAPTTVTTPIAAPANVTASNIVGVTNSSQQCASVNGCLVNVSWNNSNPAALVTAVVTRSDGINIPVLAGATSVIDNNATANTTYTYTVMLKAGANSISASTLGVKTLPYLPGATNVVATQTTVNSVQLTFDDQAYGETAYNVAMWDNGVGNAVAGTYVVTNFNAPGLGGNYKLDITNLNLVVGHQYYFEVIATAAGGSVWGATGNNPNYSTPSNTITPASVDLVAPTNVTASNVVGATNADQQCATLNGCSVNISWNNSNIAGSFTSAVLRSDGVNIPVASGATSVIDNNATANTTYTYTVTLNGSSNSVSAITPTGVKTLPYLPGATNVVATQTSVNSVQLTFDDQAYGETGYNVAMWDNGVGNAVAGTYVVTNFNAPGLGGNYKLDITNLNLVVGHQYYFKVIATAVGGSVWGAVGNSSNYSTQSNIIAP